VIGAVSAGGDGKGIQIGPRQKQIGVAAAVCLILGRARSSPMDAVETVGRGGALLEHQTAAGPPHRARIQFARAASRREALRRAVVSITEGCAASKAMISPHAWAECRRPPSEIDHAVAGGQSGQHREQQNL
jgi:hypothetical protein